jgi:hypothetical protein
MSIYLIEIFSEEPNPSPLDGVAKGDIKAQDEHRVIISMPCQDSSGVILSIGNNTMNMENWTAVLLTTSDEKVVNNPKIQ